MIDEKKLLEVMERWKRGGIEEHEQSAFNLAIDLIEIQPKVDKWIPCSERLPKIGKRALITTTNHGVRFATRLKYGWDGYIFPYAMEEVTAWQPLPEPYEVKDND